MHIVTGAAGCNEVSIDGLPLFRLLTTHTRAGRQNLGACINPIKQHRGNWSAFYLQAQGTYSYGRLTATSTEMRWQVVIAEEERVVDDVLIVRK